MISDDNLEKYFIKENYRSSNVSDDIKEALGLYGFHVHCRICNSPIEEGDEYFAHFDIGIPFCSRDCIDEIKEKEK